MNSFVNKLYYESHVTIEPVFEEKLAQFYNICLKHKFRVAELLMQQRKQDVPERSNKDSFCTSRSQYYSDIRTRTINLIEELRRKGFKVWRYKIEDTLVDSKIVDSLSLLR